MVQSVTQHTDFKRGNLLPECTEVSRSTCKCTFTYGHNSYCLPCKNSTKFTNVKQRYVYRFPTLNFTILNSRGKYMQKLKKNMASPRLIFTMPLAKFRTSLNRLSRSSHPLHIYGRLLSRVLSNPEEKRTKYGQNSICAPQ